MNLDLNVKDLRAYLDDASAFVMRFYRDLPARKVLHSHNEEEVAKRFTDPLPRAPTDLGALIDRIEREVLSATAINASAQFHSYIISSGNPVAGVAGMLEATMNLCASKWNTAASAAEMERCVIRWLAEFIGYSRCAGGVLVSGGSMANATAMAVARNSKAGTAVRSRGLFGARQMRVYGSEDVHSSIELALDWLGIGRKNFIRIPTCDDFTLDCDALEERILADVGEFAPMCVVASAGTTNTGAVDPLEAVADVCERYGLWFHVDGAYGAPAARTESAGALFRGLDRADSVTLDPHKWLFLPIGVGCLLVQNGALLKHACQLTPDYLQPGEDQAAAATRHEWIDYTYEMTRPFRALPIWMTLMAYGSDRIVAAIENTIDVMQRFAAMIADADEFELVTPAKLSTVCFRFRSRNHHLWRRPSAVDALTSDLLQALERDGRVFVAGTLIDNRKVIRACSVNHRVTEMDAEFLFAVLRDVGRKVERKSSKRAQERKAKSSTSAAGRKNPSVSASDSSPSKIKKNQDSGGGKHNEVFRITSVDSSDIDQHAPECRDHGK